MVWSGREISQLWIQVQGPITGGPVLSTGVTRGGVIREWRLSVLRSVLVLFTWTVSARLSQPDCESRYRDAMVEKTNCHLAQGFHPAVQPGREVFWLWIQIWGLPSGETVLGTGVTQRCNQEAQTMERSPKLVLNRPFATVLFLNRFGVTSPDFRRDIHAQHSRQCCDTRCFLETGLWQP